MARKRKTQQRSMLDLPLRGEERSADPGAAPETTPAPEEPPRPDPTPPPARPIDRRRRHKRRENRRGWPLLLILLLILGAAGFAVYRLTAPVAGFSVESVEFEEQLVGGATEAVELVVTNTGSRAMNVTGVRFVGDAAEEFEVVADECSGSVRESGEACAIRIAFRPKANGRRSAELDLKGNAIGRLPVSGDGAAPVLTVERPDVDFGPQPVDGRSASRSIALRNEGAAPLVVESVTVGGEHTRDFAAEPACAGRELPPGESCAVRVGFTPRSAGERSAALEVLGAGSDAPISIELRGSGVWSGQTLAAVPETIDFGMQRLGRTSDARRIAFVNRTAEPVAVGEVQLEAGDSGIAMLRHDCRQASLGPGEECGVELTFAPTAVGPTSAALQVLTAAGEESAATLSGRGVEPRLTLEREALEFGELRVGFERQRKAVLTNSGTDTVMFGEASLAGSGASSYRKVKDGCSGFKLEPGRTCSIELAFEPARRGRLDADLRVESDAAGGRKTIALRGEGTTAELTVDRQRLDFGSIRRPGNADESLTLTNGGSARLQIQRVSVAGSAAADFVVAAIGCGESGLAPDASCRITVRFVPRADGARSAQLIIRHDGEGPAKEVELVGTALAAQPVFQASSSMLDFGTRQVGSRSSVETVTVANPGDGRLELSLISIDGAHASEFTMVPGTCDGAPFVAPRANCTIGVRFTPRANGERRATLRIRHNAGGEGRVELTGVGSGG